MEVLDAPTMLVALVDRDDIVFVLDGAIGDEHPIERGLAARRVSLMRPDDVHRHGKALSRGMVWQIEHDGRRAPLELGHPLPTPPPPPPRPQLRPPHPPRPPHL